MNINELNYSIGNKKIGRDTIIFNMGSATHCASKKAGLCNIDCYAMKAERMYPQVLPYRNKQENYWLENKAGDIAMDLCEALAKHKKVRFVRINESGDLHSEKCLTKLIEIAEIVKQNFPKVVLYTYTHRSDLVNDETHTRLTDTNLVINCSNFSRKGLNTFEAIAEIKVHGMADIAKVKKEILNFGADYACHGDCSACGYCKKSHGKKIGVPLH